MNLKTLSQFVLGGQIAPSNTDLQLVQVQRTIRVGGLTPGGSMLTLLIGASGLNIPTAEPFETLIDVAEMQAQSGFTDAKLLGLYMDLDTAIISAVSVTPIPIYNTLGEFVARTISGQLRFFATPDATVAGGGSTPGALIAEGARMPSPLLFGGANPNAEVQWGQLASAVPDIQPSESVAGTVVANMYGLFRQVT